MHVEIEVRRIQRVCDPFEGNPWGIKVTRKDVRRAIDEGRLESVPGGEDHAARIAYLVLNEASDPIQMDIGVPEAGCGTPGWIVTDGNHRLAAAVYARRRVIKAAVSGSVAYGKRLFGVVI